MFEAVFQNRNLILCVFTDNLDAKRILKIYRSTLITSTKFDLIKK